MDDFQECIDACLACVVECEKCAGFCVEIAEEAYVQCTVLCRDCADTCTLCARFTARESLFFQTVCELCAEVCLVCAEECDKYTDHEPFRKCAIACRECAEKCKKIASQDII